uniref:Odorant binding protein n=1 Tax=Heliothis virescens TaxID=7102 RepID=A0A2A4IYN4_HELVI
MFKLCVFLALSVALCYGAPDRGVACGKVPGTINRCLVFPSGVSREIWQICNKLQGECEQLTCTFREYNLLDDEVINKERALAFFDNYTRENATFTAAVEHIKSECLGSVALKPQGIYFDCPVYDVLFCVYRNLIKHAAPSQWSTTPECTAERAFAAACPICPDECFKPEVPAGSCNDC